MGRRGRVEQGAPQREEESAATPPRRHAAPTHGILRAHRAQLGPEGVEGGGAARRGGEPGKHRGEAIGGHILREARRQARRQQRAQRRAGAHAQQGGLPPRGARWLGIGTLPLTLTLHLTLSLTRTRTRTLTCRRAALAGSASVRYP